jgi:hypothetical protein
VQVGSELSGGLGVIGNGLKVFYIVVSPSPVNGYGHENKK